MADKEILQANEKANEEAAGGAAPEEIGDVQIADEVLSIVAKCLKRRARYGRRACCKC